MCWVLRCVSLCHGSLCHMVRGPHCWISSPRLTQPVTQPRLHHTNLPPPPPPPSLKTPGLVWRGLVTSWCGLGTPCLVIDIFYAFLLNLWDNPWQDPAVAIIHSLDTALRLNTLFSICPPEFSFCKWFDFIFIPHRVFYISIELYFPVSGKWISRIIAVQNQNCCHEHWFYPILWVSVK